MLQTTDPTTDVGSLCTGSRCFSEQDIGKDEGDANCSLIKRKLRTQCDGGSGIESATDLLALGDSMKIKGQVHGKLILNRQKEQSESRIANR